MIGWTVIRLLNFQGGYALGDAKKSTRDSCVSCGVELTEANSFYSDTESGINPYCIHCQQKYFERLQAENGTHLALYFCCIKYDIPCNPMVVPEDVDSDQFLQSEDAKDGVWIYYLRKIESTKLYKEDSEIPNFFDGVTNILRIFGKNFTERDFSKYVQYEQERFESLEGTERQRERWGETYSAEEYDELDRLYESRKESFKGVTLTAQMEDTLVKVCRWNLKIDQYIEDGNIKLAKDLQSMVETALASESMRKKDEKPVEALRVDALIEALESFGLMKDGYFLTYDETVKALRDNLVKSKKYDYSLDVADQIILDILNNMRANEDLELLTELEERYSAEDEYGEFEPEETEREISAKRYAGLTKVSIVPNKQED